MATTTLSPITPSATTGTQIPGDAAGDTDNVILGVGNNTVIIIQAPTGAATVATLEVQRTARPGDSQYPPQTVADKVLNIAAGQVGVFGPIESAYRDVDGKAHVTIAPHAGVKISAINLP